MIPQILVRNLDAVIEDGDRHSAPGRPLLPRATRFDVGAGNPTHLTRVLQMPLTAEEGIPGRIVHLVIAAAPAHETDERGSDDERRDQHHDPAKRTRETMAHLDLL